MVNLFRRFQQPLMILITVFTIISFTVFYSRSDFMDKGSASRVGMIYGRNFSQAEFMREGRKYDLCQYVLPELWQSLIQPATNADEAMNNFVWNSVVLRHEAEQLGIRPTDSEVETAIKALPPFQTNGVYDSFKYTQFVSNALNPRGLMPDTLEEMVGNDIRLKKVKAILGTTLPASPKELRSMFEQGHRKLETQVVRFDFAEFLKAQQPTDDDVKKAFDERKSTLKTEELRKVKYVAFRIPNEEKPLVGKERVDAFEKLSEKAQEFMVAMTDKSAKFEDVAAKLGAKVQETPAFSQDEPPAELEKSPKAAAAAFKLTKTEPASDAVQTDKGYFLLQLTDVVPAREKTFDEAKTALAEDLKNERAQEAMTLKATDVRNKIEAELKAGKSFADAATAAGVKAEPYAPFSLATPPFKEKDGREVTIASRDLEEGQLSQFVPAGSGGGLLVYLAKKLPLDEKEFTDGKEALADQLARGKTESIFHEWFKQRRAAANILLARAKEAKS
ncbi:MAG: SurA N-terminal domain-containing protein [Chthoniobacteraceae bacterium]